MNIQDQSSVGLSEPMEYLKVYGLSVIGLS